ncbi:hypothetical protein GCM10009102_01620 [Sphingomonas insulae]|uniref:Uncharacterized protein n=2 Tax=Sphingomonas insulae TaxID=424800 RepID=A0ABN1HL22_9SPHN
MRRTTRGDEHRKVPSAGMSHIVRANDRCEDAMIRIALPVSLAGAGSAAGGEGCEACRPAVTRAGTCAALSGPAGHVMRRVSVVPPVRSVAPGNDGRIVVGGISVDDPACRAGRGAR